MLLIPEKLHMGWLAPATVLHNKCSILLGYLLEEQIHPDYQGYYLDYSPFSEAIVPALPRTSDTFIGIAENLCS